MENTFMGSLKQKVQKTNYAIRRQSVSFPKLSLFLKDLQEQKKALWPWHFPLWWRWWGFLCWLWIILKGGTWGKSPLPEAVRIILRLLQAFSEKVNYFHPEGKNGHYIICHIYMETCCFVRANLFCLFGRIWHKEWWGLEVLIIKELRNLH